MKVLVRLINPKLLFFLFLSISMNKNYAQKKGNNILDQPRTIKLSPFSTLKVNSGIVLNLIPSDENKVVIYGDTYSGVRVQEKGFSLKLKIRFSELISYNQPYIDLYYTEELAQIKIHQGSVVKALRPVKTENLILKAHEGSEFSGEIMATELTTKVHTGSFVNLYGRVKIHRLKVNTGGVCRAEEMLSDHSWVTTFAGGNGKVYVDEKVFAKVHFGGNIYLFGNPKEIYASRTFGGNIIDGYGFDHKENQRRHSRLNKY